MAGEIEWLDSGGCSAANEETLDVGGKWPAAAWLARVTHWPWWQPTFRPIALAPVAVVAVLTFGPSSPGSTDAGHGVTTYRICMISEPAAADTAPAARNLPGSLLAEQVQHLPRGGLCMRVARVGGEGGTP
ncbi:MAG TPA: hypothetical protein VE442_13150 [Jatrophihabitans sp.]|nr:hypothetical protein [Jatrophihabitans sp.]